MPEKLADDYFKLYTAL